MVAIAARGTIDWRCRHNWRRASKNTAWCLLGCAIDDFGTIAFSQFTGIPWPTLAIMTLAIMNGVDWALTGAAVLTWWVLPIMLAAGFVTPLPYNYWRLKAPGRACH